MPEISRCPPYYPPPHVELICEQNTESIEVYVANDDEWKAYKTKFNKLYSEEEETLKYASILNHLEHFEYLIQKFKATRMGKINRIG